MKKATFSFLFAMTVYMPLRFVSPDLKSWPEYIINLFAIWFLLCMGDSIYDFVQKNF